MQGFGTLFIVAVGFIIVVSIIMFGMAFFRTARLSNKIFGAVEREMDRHAAASKPAERIKCEYCGCKVEAEGKCSNCGAPGA